MLPLPNSGEYPVNVCDNERFVDISSRYSYTGAQVAIASYFINYCTDEAGKTSSTGAQLLAGAQGSFALGRFAGVLIMKYTRPRWVFLFYLTM